MPRLPGTRGRVTCQVGRVVVLGVFSLAQQQHVCLHSTTATLQHTNSSQSTIIRVRQSQPTTPARTQPTARNKIIISSKVPAIVQMFSFHFFLVANIILLESLWVVHSRHAFELLSSLKPFHKFDNDTCLVLPVHTCRTREARQAVQREVRGAQGRQ